MRAYGSSRARETACRRAVPILVLTWFVLAAISCKSGFPTKPSDETMDRRSEDKPVVISGVSGSAKLQYILTLPAESAGGERLPLIVFLHSLEERGGPLELLLDNPDGQGVGLAGYASVEDSFPFATLSPLCPRYGYWTFMHHRLAELIQEIVADHRLDPERVFLSGVSMGGMGTWSLGMARPDLFRALAPIAGPVYSPPIRPRYGRLAGLPVFAFHDRHDPSIPFALAESSVEKLKLQGGRGRLTEYDTGRHYIQELVFADGELFKWLLDLPKPLHTE